METITFYSYKGGVGRTLALANVAIYLSRFGQNVCIMDFDLEAPGLHYKFPQLFKTNDIKGGLVDYIYKFTHNKVTSESLDKFSLGIIPASKSQGGIRLIPAGDVLSADYWRKLAAINWHSLFYEEDSEGIPFFLELKERIREEFDPDFLLVDSRTGITEMSGLCTSLLPDKVVFLIVNNQENIGGARQILQSIQGVERLPGQRPIEVTFALTRIPFPKEEEKEKDEEVEKQIVKDIQDFLNAPVEDLESQLNIQDICILHSDRELELSESLRISQEGVTKETPLLRDYLRLFSKIIPDEVILPKLDSVLEEITATANLFENPDKTQQELEGLVASYLHPKSLEKLIDFYILRNVGRDKTLSAFHDLWKTFGIENSKILSKYVSLFMKWDLSSWEEQEEFELAIIEKYLELNPGDRIVVEKRLAEAYKEYDKPEMALNHYLQLLDEVKEKNEIFGEILDIYIEKELYKGAMELFEKYSAIIDTDVSLRVKEVEVMFKVGKVEEVRKLLEDGGITERALSDKNPSLYIGVMEKLGKSEEANKKLNMMLNEALMRGDPDRLYSVGMIFYRLDRADEFKNKILGKHPKADDILRLLEHRSFF
jgi:MinD-like ATPase involved in chromosome partitioning or flagellar assembly